MRTNQRRRNIKPGIILVGMGCLLMLNRPVQGQDSVRCGQWLSVNLHYGFIMPAYNSSMTYLIKAHVPGIEADYLYKPSGDKPWERDYHYAEKGIAFLCMAWQPYRTGKYDGRISLFKLSPAAQLP